MRVCMSAKFLRQAWFDLACVCWHCSKRRREVKLCQGNIEAERVAKYARVRSEGVPLETRCISDHLWAMARATRQEAERQRERSSCHTCVSLFGSDRWSHSAIVGLSLSLVLSLQTPLPKHVHWCALFRTGWPLKSVLRWKLGASLIMFSQCPVQHEEKDWTPERAKPHVPILRPYEPFLAAAKYAALSIMLNPSSCCTVPYQHKITGAFCCQRDTLLTVRFLRACSLIP